MEEQKNFKQNTRAKSTGTKALIGVLLLTTIASLCIVMYAWARYMTTDGGTASANVAKWHFELKRGVKDEGPEEYLALTRTDGYDYVAEGKVAPGTFGEIPIEIDTTGTEVDLSYDLEVRIQNCPLNMTFKNSANEVIEPTRSGTGENGSPRVAVIRISKYVPYTVEDANRIHDETIKWNWNYRTGTTDGEMLANDAIDTKDAGKEMTVQVSVTGIEVTTKPILAGTIKATTTQGTTNVANGGAISLEMGKTLSLSVADSGAGTATMEEVTYASSAPAVATVSQAGEVTPVAKGTTTITMTGKETGNKVSVVLTVVGKSITNTTVTYGTGTGTAITNGGTITLEPNGSTQLNVASDGESVTYSVVEGSSIISVAQDGTITAGATPGTGKIRITGESGDYIEINVTVTEPPIATLKKPNGDDLVITSDNIADVIGEEVNYSTGNEESGVVYRVFYVDNEDGPEGKGKYGDGKGTVYLVAQKKSGTTYGQVKTTEISSQTYTTDASDPYSGLNLMKKLNPQWASVDGTINNNNEMGTARLCTPGNFSAYYDSSKANYVVGAPSAEMYVDAYNQKLGLTGANSYKVRCQSGSTGYQYSVNGGSSYVYYTANNTIQATNNLFMNSSQSWWLASPSAYNANDVCDVYGSNASLRRNSYTSPNGVWPLVSLKSGIQP